MADWNQMYAAYAAAAGGQQPGYGAAGGAYGGHSGGRGRSRSRSRGRRSRSRSRSRDRNRHAISKDNYRETQATGARNEGEVQAWRQQNDVFCERECPKPILTFDEYEWPRYIMDNINRMGFKNPTPIQAQGWPVALMGRDFVGIAETGSGKTLAYALPAIMHINSQPRLNRGDGPICLTLAPTRELATQIEAEFRKFGESTDCRIAVCYGGAPKREQERQLWNTPAVIVATPGRLIDFLQNRTTNMDRVSYLILDEADRMLDMGFEPQIKDIIRRIRGDRQTMMYSATWPKEVRSLAESYLKNYVKVTIGSQSLKANHRVSQEFTFCQEYEKPPKLCELMNGFCAQNPGSRILIFTGMKKKADEITIALRRAGIAALAIHGDKQQREREWVLNEFKQGTHPIMVATDVAARGLDVKDVKLVINYDLPSNAEDYVHRIGRTARAGATGVAHSMITNSDMRMCKDIMKLLVDAKQPVPPQLQQYAEQARSMGLKKTGRYGGGGGGGFRGGGDFRSGANAMGMGMGGGGGYRSRPY